MTNKLENLNKPMKNMFKGFYIVVVLFLIFFFINLFISVKSGHESAYSFLNREHEKSKLKLQDTRVHNWSELEKKKN